MSIPRSQTKCSARTSSDPADHASRTSVSSESVASDLLRKASATLGSEYTSSRWMPYIRVDFPDPGFPMKQKGCWLSLFSQALKLMSMILG